MPGTIVQFFATRQEIPAFVDRGVQMLACAGSYHYILGDPRE